MSEFPLRPEFRPSLLEVVTAVCEYPDLFTPHGTFIEASAWLHGFECALSNEPDVDDEWGLFRMWLPKQLGYASNCVWLWVLQKEFPEDTTAFKHLHLLFATYSAIDNKFVTLRNQGFRGYPRVSRQTEVRLAPPAEIIIQICKRPFIHCINRRLEEACCFMLGLVAGQRRTVPQVVIEWETFESWLLSQFDHPFSDYPDAYAWYHLLRSRCPEDEAAFVELNRLAEKYLALSAN